MSQIGKNIRKIRMVKKMSQNDFAKIFDVARPSIGAYEEGRAEPKIETVIQIAKHFGISIDALLTKEITINELLKFKVVDDAEIEKSKTSNNDELLNATPYVARDKHSEYVVHVGNKDFINGLPILRLPDIDANKSRAFQVSGSAMEFGNGGIRNNDILVCKFLDMSKHELAIDQVYVLVHTQGVAQKRFKKKTEGGFLFESDNSSYENLQIPEAEMLEVWSPVFIISDKFSQPQELEHRLSDLESKLQTLLDQGYKK